MTDTLSPFEGLDVTEAGIEIPGAAGGLREAMKIDPAEFHKGDRVFIALECVAQKVRFDPIDKDDPIGQQRRVHVFSVEQATIVDEDLVRAQLDEQAERIQAMKDAEAGQETIVTAEARQAHDNGDHADGLVDGCPSCDEEAELEAAGL